MMRVSRSSVSAAVFAVTLFVLIEQVRERCHRFLSCPKPSGARRHRHLVTFDESRREPDNRERVRDPIFEQRVLHPRTLYTASRAPRNGRCSGLHTARAMTVVATSATEM